MRTIIILMAFTVLMLPPVYLLFFTSFVDRILLRLRLGGRAATLEDKASTVKKEAGRYAEEISKQQREMADAAARLEAVAGKPKTRARRALYAIQSRRSGMYWSKDGEWRDIEHRAEYDSTGKRNIKLPDGGQWERIN